MRRLVPLTLLVAGVAQASPLLAPSPGGPVFVGPTSPHVTAIFWNPAAAGLLQGTHLLVWSAARFDMSTVQRSTISTADGEPSPSGDKAFPETSATAVTPGAFIGLTSDLSSQNVTIALAVLMPFAERWADYDEILGYHSLGGSLYAPSGSLALSYRVSQSFYAGIAASLIFPKLDFDLLRDRALGACSAPPCDLENPANAQRWSLRSGWDAVPGLSFETVGGLNIGGLARFGDWWIGLGIDFLFLGEAGKMADVTVANAGGATFTSRARVKFRLPQLAHLGVRRRAFGDFDLLVNATYVRTSQHENVDVRLVSSPAPDVPEWLVRHRGFADTFALEVGLEQPRPERVRLGGRVRVESSVVPPGKVSAAQLDAPKAELAAGAELRLSDSVALIAGASLTLLLPVDSQPSDFTPRAAIDCAASGYDLSTAACTATREGRAIPTAAGSYSRIGAQLSLGFTYDWW